MAKVASHPLMGDIHGEIAGLIYYPNPDGGGLILRKKGQRTAPLSPAQVAHTERMKLAALYGNMVKNDPVLAEIYRPFCEKHMTPYHVALRDYLKPPRVEQIDMELFTGRPGGVVRIHAFDDTAVLSVVVVVRKLTGEVLEEGAAQLSTIVNVWIYTETAEIVPETGIVIEVTAMDRPQHVGRALVQHVVA